MLQLIRPLPGRSGLFRARPAAQTFAGRLVPNAFSGLAWPYPDRATIHFVFGSVPERGTATDPRDDVGMGTIGRDAGNFHSNDLASPSLPPVHNCSPAGVPYYVEVNSTDPSPVRPGSYAATLHPALAAAWGLHQAADEPGHPFLTLDASGDFIVASPPA